MFDGPDKIDGVAVDYARWPVLENPWMRQGVGEAILVLQTGGEKVVYDFNQWKRLVEFSIKPTK